MARTPKPWFWEARGVWMVTKNGERHNLGPDEQEAHRLFHELMARKPEAPAPVKEEAPLVADVCDKFLDFCQKNRTAKTYKWYRDFIQGFISTLPRPAEMTVEQLKPFHVVEWCDANSDWTANTRRGAIIAVTRAFNWAEKLGYIDRNPIRNVEKPKAEPRGEFLTVPEWEQIRDHYEEGDPFREMLTFMWLTGCRPFEARELKPQYVDLDNGICVIPRKKAKGKRKPRILHLNDEAVSLLRRQLEDNGTRLVFLNEDGNPWTYHAIDSRFKRLRKHFEGKKFCPYLWRHGFANRKLTAGHDHLGVAELMGHSDGAMLSRVYGHLAESPDHLKRIINSD